MVLCDREFDSKAVYQTLSNLDVNYLICSVERKTAAVLKF